MRNLLICVLLMLLLAACGDDGRGGSGAETDARHAEAATPSAVGGSAATRTAPPSAADVKRARASVDAVVNELGAHMKQVSLLAAPDQVRRDIRAQYALLAAPDLLQRWLDDPTSAPGRKVSSPWPARIEITRITPITAQVYAVVGELVYVDSTGVAATEPVRIKVQGKAGGPWRISEYDAGSGATIDNDKD